MRRLALLVILFLLVLVQFVFYAKAPVKTKHQIAQNEIVSYSADIKVPSTRLRIATYNIGYAYGDQNNVGLVLKKKDVLKNLNDAVIELSQLDADVICLQEIDFDSHRTYGIDQLDYLAKHLGFEFAAYAVNWNKRYLPFPYWPPQKQFGRIVSGQAVLSRYPLLENKLTVFEKPPNAFWYNWFYIERAAQRVSFNFQNQRLVLWNVHLEAFHRPTRLKQAHVLAGIVNADPSPYKIVVGDFNDPQAKTKAHEQNAAYQFLKETKMQGDLEFQDTLTFPSWEPIEKLDQVFFSKEFAYRDSDTLPKLKTSDHLPIWVDLEAVSHD